MRLMNEAAPLRQLVELYLLRCEVEGKSPQTVRAYRETLGRFLRFVTAESAGAILPANL